MVRRAEVVVLSAIDGWMAESGNGGEERVDRQSRDGGSQVGGLAGWRWEEWRGWC